MRAGRRFIAHCTSHPILDMPPTSTVLPDGRSATFSREVTEADLPTVSFIGRIEVDGEVLVSESTLRFRERFEIERDLARHGFHVTDVRDAPDRPGKEFVFLAQRA